MAAAKGATSGRRRKRTEAPRRPMPAPLSTRMSPIGAPSPLADQASLLQRFFALDQVGPNRLGRMLWTERSPCSMSSWTHGYNSAKRGFRASSLSSMQGFPRDNAANACHLSSDSLGLAMHTGAARRLAEISARATADHPPESAG